MSYTKAISPIINVCGVFISVLLTNEILQMIIFILSIIGLLFNLIFTIIRWWKEAKKDGKIDSSEIDELQQKIDDVIKRK